MIKCGFLVTFRTVRWRLTVLLAVVVEAVVHAGDGSDRGVHSEEVRDQPVGHAFLPAVAPPQPGQRRADQVFADPGEGRAGCARVQGRGLVHTHQPYRKRPGETWRQATVTAPCTN